MELKKLMILTRWGGSWQNQDCQSNRRWWI